LQRVKLLLKPTEDWGPATPHHKAIYERLRCKKGSEEDGEDFGNASQLIYKGSPEIRIEGVEEGIATN
jgi:hypothetical protein